jgi:hypothetical protein
MAHDGTGAGWSTTAPANSDAALDGAKEIRDLRIGVGARMSKEHVALAAAGAGGEHLAGSAVAFVEATVDEPTTRPDGVSLSADDAGRLWVDLTLGTLTYWNGTAWTDLLVSAVVDDSVTTAMIQDDAVDKDKIAADVAGDGLAQNVDGSLEVTVDDSTIEIDTGVLGVKDDGITTDKILDAAVTAAKLASDTAFTQMKIATYVGDGGTSNAVTGVGFAPDVVILLHFSTSATYVPVVGIRPETALRMFQGNYYAAAIQWGSDGFTIKNSLVHFNRSGYTYYYVALRRVT